MRLETYREELGGEPGIHHSFVHSSQSVQFRSSDEHNEWHEFSSLQHLQGLRRKYTVKTGIRELRSLGHFQQT